MIKYVITLGALLMLSSSMFLFNKDKEELNQTNIINANRDIPLVEIAKSLTPKDTSETPDEIKIPSSVGEIVFPHKFHIEDEEIECIECHHQINATELETPHPEYLKSSWIKCNICHKGSDYETMEVYTCSKCHHSTLENIVDETLSAKVVIHKKCWSCHDIGTGAEASENCSMCHSGPKTKK